MTDSASCTLSSVAGDISNSASCSVASNVLTLVDPFGASGVYDSAVSTQMEFVFSGGGTNPISATDAGNF